MYLHVHHSLLTHSSGRLEAIFWADAKMRQDYQVFKDVFIFDTTYKTNRYDLICGPFVGINNHWSTVMFGCSFIANETAETFTWLFKEFLIAMDEKKPITIFIDQDAAMAKAIAEVTPYSSWFICLFIMEYMPIHHDCILFALI